MENILFRAKRIDNNEWIYGLLGYCNFNHGAERAIIQKTELGSIIPRRIADNTISQYTGLKDKNGVEIYEGDILKLYSPDGGNCIFCSVGFGECEDAEGDTCYALYVELNGEKAIMYPQYNQYEISGNIWDNPELLKEVEE